MNFVALLLALAAPLPIPKPAPAVTPGEYAVTYHGSPWTYWLHADGTLEGRRDGAADGDGYVGTWRQDGWTLHVEEWRRGGDPLCRWPALLRGEGPITAKRR